MKQQAVIHDQRMWRAWCPGGQDVPAARAVLAVQQLAGTGGDTVIFRDGLMVRIEPVGARLEEPTP